MTKYLSSSPFSVHAPTGKNYAENWEATFGKKEVECVICNGPCTYTVFTTVDDVKKQLRDVGLQMRKLGMTYTIVPLDGQCEVSVTIRPK
jgi:hypothetical protein